MSDFFNFPMWAVEKPKEPEMRVPVVLLTDEQIAAANEERPKDPPWRMGDVVLKEIDPPKRPGRPKGSKNKEAA